jgi:hypothetical protein
VLSPEEIVQIAKDCEILKLFGAAQTNTITVDYVPPRVGMIIPREPGDGPFNIHPRPCEELTFELESVIFHSAGGAVFVAVTCRGVFVTPPFKWESYAKLAVTRLT